MKTLACAIALLMIAPAVSAQQGDGTAVTIAANVFKPAKVPATPERIASLKVPAGFKVDAWATGLLNPRILVVAPDGGVYVSRRDQGDVLLLRDQDGDGRADGPPVVVANRPNVHGLALHDGKLYMATVKELFVADIQPDGTLGPLTMLVGDLPDGGQHPNRTMAFGPDGMLYMSIGSTCNACNDTNPENATILRMSPDGQSRTIFASGLRNTIGFDWQPATGELWGMDHGIDFLGDDVQPEELNRIEKGRQYGWPHVYGSGGINPQSTPPGEITKEQWRAQSVPMVMGYTAHAAPMQMLFYTGASFPKAYRGDAFIAMRGSWNRRPASGYEIVRIHFANGRPAGMEPFVSGFLSDGGAAHFARPVGLAQLADGSLLMSDDGNGAIYRVSYAAASAQARVDTRTTSARKIPGGPMQVQNAKGIGVPLALVRSETATRGKGTAIVLQSTTFTDGGAMPARSSDYADGVSPQLSWSAVPGAVSYAVIAEDPDAKPITPFVHWVAWNVPAETTSLPEGLQEQLRLTDPAGLLQGRNSRGSIGYYGPHPPVGDPPHHYHFQVLALDTMLDVPAGSDRDTVLAAAKGHVLAKSERVGTFQQTVKPPR